MSSGCLPDDVDNGAGRDPDTALAGASIDALARDADGVAPSTPAIAWRSSASRIEHWVHA
jgi:hypothetical protein